MIMPNSTTSPSNFIYRRPVTSLTQEDTAMRPERSTKATSTRSLPVTAAEWEVVNPKSLPLSTRECTCPAVHTDLPYSKTESDLYEQPLYSNTCHGLVETEAPNRNAPPRIIKPEPGTHSPPSLAQHPSWLSPPPEQAPDSTFPHSPVPVSTPTDSRNWTSSLAASSSRTVSIPSNSSSSGRFVNICATIRAIHDICLQSTRTYIDTHIANRRARAASQGWSTVCHGNGSGSSGSSAGASNATTNTTTHSAIPPSTPSLLLNTSSICTMLWSGSQRDRLHVLNVERLAIETMGRLMRWAETVTLGEWDEWQGADEQFLWQVLEAGRHLCSWLGVPDAIQAMEALEGEILGDYGIS